MYSGTSVKGPSKKATTSLQRTLSISPTLYRVNTFSTSEKRTRDKTASPKVSFSQRFHCSLFNLSCHERVLKTMKVLLHLVEPLINNNLPRKGQPPYKASNIPKVYNYVIHFKLLKRGQPRDKTVKCPLLGGSTIYCIAKTVITSLTTTVYGITTIFFFGIHSN